jgi:hypothetical protein
MAEAKQAGITVTAAILLVFMSDNDIQLGSYYGISGFCEDEHTCYTQSSGYIHVI